MPCVECPYNGKIKVNNVLVASPLLIVGEAPAKEEVMKGLPFVGKSGEVLDRALFHTGLLRKDVSICNSMKCMLDRSNQKEVNKALRECREYLSEDIKRVSPKVIITLGETAMYQVLKLKKITTNNGRVIFSEEFNCWVIPTFHPSYLLRNGLGGFYTNSQLELLVLNTFKEAYKIIKGEASPILTNYVEGNKQHIDMLIASPAIAVDAEFTEDKLLCIGFSNKEGHAYVYFPENFKYAAQILAAPNRKIVTFRPTEEHLFKKYGYKMNGQVIDVLTMAHILDENHYKYSLEAIADVYTPLKKIKDKAEGMRFELDKAPKEVVFNYNAIDCDATYRCYKAMSSLYRAEPKLARYYVKFMMPVQDMFTQITANGIPIDIEELRKVEAELLRLQSTYESKAIQMLPPSIRAKYESNLKLTRSAIIVDMCFAHPDGLKLTATAFTDKTKQPSTDDDHLKQFIKHKFVEYLLEWKKISKLLATYIPNLYKYYNNGYIYPLVSFTSTVTGRTSMAKPSMQNFPKHGKYANYLRRVICAPPKWVLVETDLSQSEVRIMGWLAQDQNILNALRNKVDIHTRTASIVAGKPIDKVDKEERRKAKACVFGFLYGMTEESFVEYAKNDYGITFTLKQAQEVRRKFFSKPEGYYALPLFHAKMIALARAYGYVEQPLGRRRRLNTINSEDRGMRGRAERQSINFPIQAFSSDLALIGMLCFHKKYKDNPDVKILLFIHDAVIVMCKETIAKEVIAELKKSMTIEAAEYIKTNFDIKVGYPIEVDTKIGYSLASMQEQKEVS